MGKLVMEPRNNTSQEGHVERYKWVAIQPMKI